jgi:hypothetical protein
MALLSGVALLYGIYEKLNTVFLTVFLIYSRQTADRNFNEKHNAFLFTIHYASIRQWM